MIEELLKKKMESKEVGAVEGSSI